MNAVALARVRVGCEISDWYAAGATAFHEVLQVQRPNSKFPDRGGKNVEQDLQFWLFL